METSQTSLSGILIEQLFGLYDYALGSYSAGAPFDPSLAILYGDNGSGKTTLLSLVYHLLSKETNQGHRTFLAAVPFRQFKVRLARGTEVGAVREQGQLTGPYTYYIDSPGGQRVEWTTRLADDGGVPPPPEGTDERSRWSAAMEALNALDIALYYLPDHRRPETNKSRGDEVDVDLAGWDVVRQTGPGERLIRRRSHSSRPLLDSALHSFQEAIRTEALRAASTGEANTSSLYTEIARRIVKTRRAVAASASEGKDLVTLLDRLNDRSKPFSRLGLIPDLTLGELRSLASTARATTQRILASVLQPYIESVSARLDALGPTQQLLSTFVSLINSFFTHKQLSYSLRHGLRIWQPDGARLFPRALSSGEQQLLLLFCNTVRARSQATLFIIDEPELSLNVKWQRRLLEALLALVEGSRVQFIVATHSVELLARHRNAVLRLEPKVAEGSV